LAYIIGRIHVEAVRRSLEDATINAKPEDCLVGIMRAALIGNTGAVSLFLDRGVPVNGCDAVGRTPLMEAVFGGHLDTVEELLKRGADVNAQDLDGWTALMEASAKGRLNVVRTLLAHGADAHKRNNRGWTALRAAAKCNTDVTRLLRQSGAL
jgi:uncharacterized protein